MALFYPLSLAMENFTALVFYLFTLLADTYKIYLRNGRLMAVIAVPIISLQTLFYVFNCFPITPSMTELIMVHTYKLALAAPGTLGFINLSIGLQKEINIFFVITQLIFLPFSVMGSFYFLAYTTNASALIHGGKKITKEDVVSRTTRSFKRPLVTYFYITLFVLGFFSLCLITLVPFMRILGGDPFTPHVSAIVLSVPAAVFYNYLAVVWELALVISIVEEKFGIEALGKAAQIVKGMKLQGFILNLLLTILSLILMLCFGLFKYSKQFPEPSQIVISMGVVSLIWMVKMFWHTAYTVFYYRCKKTHGEEVELQAPDVEYTKIPTFAPLVSENIP